MPLHIIRQDITKMQVDAIVNPTDENMSGDGGTDHAIHKGAGEKLSELCGKIAPCAVGQAKITPAYNLDCRYVIHTVGPVWKGGHEDVKRLGDCYANCLNLAITAKCNSVAMPLISSGTYGFPKDIVLKTATNVISDFLYDNEMTVYLVVFDKDSYEISSKIYSDIKSYIDENYISDFLCRSMMKQTRMLTSSALPVMSIEPQEDAQKKKSRSMRDYVGKLFPCAYDSDDDDYCNHEEGLENMLENMDKGFRDTLFYYIDAKGITDVECYKRSNVDKKTFSKIKCKSDYRPSKITAISFAVGLKLNLEEANHLLRTAGICLSHSEKFDVIIEYFLKTGNYGNIHEVNEVLYKFDQALLGV